MRNGFVVAVALLSWLYASSASAEEVFIRMLDGHLSPTQTFTIDIPLAKTVKDLRAQIAKQKNLPADRIRLVFKATQLEDAKTLADYGVEEDSTISMVLGLTN